MKEKTQNLSSWLFGIAILVVLGVVLTSALCIKNSGVTKYPSLIANAYGEEQHHLTVPDSREVKL